jgi:cystathionine beta-lyase/cystathionine gamma-synthase
MDGNELHAATKAVHGPSREGKPSGPAVAPIVQSATFQAASLDEQSRVRAGDEFYTRYGNPTQAEAETAIAALESTDGAMVFGSGMAAITAAVLSVVRSGDHIVAQRNLYGSAYEFFAHWLPRLGVQTSFVAAAEPEELARAIRPETKLIYIESPSNPTLEIADIRATAEIAKRHELLAFIDSTFASPVNQTPKILGMDVIIHSATKFLGGHSDIICGAVAADMDFLTRLRETRIVLGGILDPHAAWLLRRGIKTLSVRVARQNENALHLAHFLEGHARVRRVYYPFLESHPQHVLAKTQMSGGGGVLSFEVDGTAEDTGTVVESLKLFALAPSLGGVESLVTIPALTSHAMLSIEERRLLGVTDQLIRVSVGIEHANDLVADLDQGLSHISVRS